MNNLSSSPFFKPHSSLSHRQPFIRILTIFLEIFANIHKYLYAFTPLPHFYTMSFVWQHASHTSQTLLYPVLFFLFSLSIIYIYMYIYLHTHTHTHTPVVIVVQSLSHVRLCDPTDCSPPGSSVHGISQARILEWVAIFFSMGSS